MPSFNFDMSVIVKVSVWKTTKYGKLIEPFQKFQRRTMPSFNFDMSVIVKMSVWKTNWEAM